MSRGPHQLSSEELPHDAFAHRPGLLTTSRNVITLPGMQRTTLEQLGASEARELLTGICQRIPDDTADQICYLCGYLPLAIRAAGSLLDVTADLDPSDYATQLREERTRLERIGTEGVDINVEASFNLSYARLSTDAARVFRQLAVFPATFDDAAEEAVCKDPGHKHLSDLLRRNLVLYNPDTRRYRLHDLARLFADSRLIDEERDAGRMHHAAHYLRVLRECHEFYLQGSGAVSGSLAVFNAEQRNIETGQKWACEHVGTNDIAVWLCNEYPYAAVFVLQLRQHPRDRLIWIEAALAAARQLRNRAAEERHLGNLGVAYEALGELRRAIECYESALAIAREIDDQRSESYALACLSNAYTRMGDAHRAIEHVEQALVIMRQIGDRRNEGNALISLGAAYVVLGELRRAIESFEQALIVAREVGDRRGEGIALGDLGSTYARLGEMHRAIDYCRQQLEISREIGDLPEQGRCTFNISVVLYTLGNLAQAIDYAETSLEIYERLESPYAESVRAQLARWHSEATEGE